MLFSAIKILSSAYLADSHLSTDTAQMFASSLLRMHKCTSGIQSLFLHSNNDVPTQTMCSSSSVCFRVVLIYSKHFHVTEYTLENNAFKIWRMGSVCSVPSSAETANWKMNASFFNASLAERMKNWKVRRHLLFSVRHRSGWYCRLCFCGSSCEVLCLLSGFWTKTDEAAFALYISEVWVFLNSSKIIHFSGGWKPGKW